MIQLVVDEVNTRIIGLDKIEIIDFISSALSYMVPGAQYSFPYKSGRWDGRERLLTRQLKFPTGLLDKVRTILDSFGLQYTIQDKINYPRGIVEMPVLATLQPYDYQKAVIQSALMKKRGTIRVATGGGKSIIIAYLAAALDLPTMIYVVSLDLLTQLKSTLERVMGTDIGTIGGGVCDIKKITVCSVWTAGLACGEKVGKSENDEDCQQDLWQPSTQERGAIEAAVRNARVVMLDESQFAAANSIRMILQNSIAAAYKYGFSATPWRSAGDDILLEAAFGNKICDISATELISQGYLVPPKIIFRDSPKMKLKRSWPVVKSNYIVNNDERNEILINNIRKLIKLGRKPLALFRELKHGRILYDELNKDLRVRMVSGQISIDDRTKIKSEFENAEVDVVLGSTVWDQGLDIVCADALVLCSGGKSTAKALQRVGRVIRTFAAGGKKDALVVDTFDQAHFVKEHSVARYEIYRTEPGFVIKTEPAMEGFLRK